MYGQRYSFCSICFGIDVMAAVNPFQFPAFLIEQFSKVLSADLLQTVISISWSSFWIL